MNNRLSKMLKNQRKRGLSLTGMASIRMVLIDGARIIRASIEMDLKMVMIEKALTSRVSAMRVTTERASILKE